MIVELFGCPGAGKTTFARALAAKLRERGHTVDLLLSHRPGECSPNETGSAPPAQQIASTISRLLRPFAEMITLARHPRAVSQDIGTARTLIRILPPSSRFWSFRIAQYVSRLSRAWLQAQNGGRIVLFDQAFVQVVCSLAVLCGEANERLISDALDVIPKSDLLVLMRAPTDILETRLLERQRLGSALERLLEFDLATNLRSLDVVDCISGLLLRRGSQIVTAASLDQRSLDEAVEQVETQIMARLGQQQRGAA
jgi:RecA/RadA recombinase